MGEQSVRSRFSEAWKKTRRAPRGSLTHVDVVPVELDALGDELVAVRREHFRVVPAHIVPAEVCALHHVSTGGAAQG